MSIDIKILFSQISSDNWSDEFENNLCYSLNCFTDDLIKNGYTEQADWIWKKALALAKNRSRFLTLSYAKHLSNRSLYIEAFEILSKCSKIYPDYAPVYDAIENTKNLIVDRWHFRMLNDEFRNNSYLRP
jgi:predicted Zn-dependent protease